MGRLNDLMSKIRRSGDNEPVVSEKDLVQQDATPVPNSNRSPWSDTVLMSSITPARLGEIMIAVRQGENPAEYLELAQEIERRDAHYGSVLSTRKAAVESLDMVVKPGGEDDQAQEIAAAIKTDIVENPAILDLLKNSLDALGKGFAVNEIIWDTSERVWKPARYLWRDQRWFKYDEKDGRTLLLRDPRGTDATPLKPYKFVVHEPLLRSGPQILGGLAYTALFLWLVKSYDVTSWAAFVDRYGYPVRLGKYGRKATKDDIATLKRAVAAIGSDVGAVIPDSMLIDIVESSNKSASAQVYERLAKWCDSQLSKLVLGQTMTTDDGSSRSQAEVHNEVRQDIVAADAVQLSRTLNRDVVRPYVLFNFGPQEHYPRVLLQQIETQDVKIVVESVEKLGPMGLKVRADEIRSMLGLSRPEDDDETIGGVAIESKDDQESDTDDATNAALALNSQGIELVEEDLVTEAEEADFVEITGDIEAVLGKALAASSTYAEFTRQLETLTAEWPADRTAELMAVATFKARILGMEEFDSD